MKIIGVLTALLLAAHALSEEKKEAHSCDSIETIDAIENVIQEKLDEGTESFTKMIDIYSQAGGQVPIETAENIQVFIEILSSISIDVNSIETRRFNEKKNAYICNATVTLSVPEDIKTTETKDDVFPILYKSRMEGMLFREVSVTILSSLVQDSRIINAFAMQREMYEYLK